MPYNLTFQSNSTFTAEGGDISTNFSNPMFFQSDEGIDTSLRETCDTTSDTTIETKQTEELQGKENKLFDVSLTNGSSEIQDSSAWDVYSAM